MSLNITPLTEIHRTVLNTSQLRVSTADLVTGFPILAPDGTLASPVYSFSSNPDSGLARTSNGVSAVIDTEVGLLAGSDSNVAMGSTPSSYGGGQGVVFLSDAAVNPVGIPNGGSGGILYVDGTDLHYLDASGSTVTLNSAGLSNINGPSSSVDNNLVKFASVSQGVVADTGITFASSQLLTADGTPSVPAYSFSTDPDSGMLLSGTNLEFSFGGITRLTVGPTITSSAPFESLGSGGSVGSPAYSFTGSATSGMFHDSNHVQISSDGAAGLAWGGSSTRNVSLVGGPGSYGANADGVVFIPDATTIPVGVPNGGSGGLLYVTGTGTQLRWLNASGVDIRLGGSVGSLGSSVDNTLLVWGDASGSSVTPRAIITDAGEIHAVQGANPVYSFTGDTTTGLFLSAANTVQFMGSGVGGLSVGTSTLTSSVQMAFAKLAPTNPAVQFNSNTGLVSQLADQLGVVVSGDEVMAGQLNNNLVFGGITGGYGTGQGVVEIVDAATNPSSAPSDGGFLYVDGNSLLFRDTSNTVHDLTATTNVATISTSTDNAAVRFDTTSGTVVQDTANILISDTNQMTCVGAQGYAFTSSTTSGLTSGGADSVSLVSGGTTSLTIATTSTTVAASHVLSGVDGSAASPSFVITGDLDTGVYSSGTNEVSLSAGGVRALTVAPNSNVSLGRDTPDFAGGQAVVNFSDVVTTPSGTLPNGGLMYVSGRDLFFHNQAGTASRISGVEGDSSSTDNLVVTMTADTTGRHIESVSGFTLSDVNQMSGPDGSAVTPPYRVSGNTGWWHAGANVLELGDGAAQLVANASAITSSVQVECVTGMRVGGSGGMTETFSGSGTTRTMGNASGTFKFDQNGTTVMQTNATRDLDLLGNKVSFTGGTGNLDIEFSTPNFDITTTNAADTLEVDVGGTTILSSTPTTNTVTNMNVDIIGAKDYRFASNSTAGFSVTGTTEIIIDGVDAVRTNTSGRMGLLNVGIPNGTRTIGVGAATTAPTSAPASGAYLYVDPSATFVRVANTNVDVAVNGPYARAKVTRTQTIATGALDLVDTLTDADSNVLVVDTGAAGTITGTADTAGFWEIGAEAHWAFNATGYRRILIKVNGAIVAQSIQNAVTTASVETQQQARVCLHVDASAAVTFEVEQNSGGNLDVDVTGTVVFLG